MAKAKADGFTVNRDALMGALHVAGDTAGRNGKIPIFACVLLEPDDLGLSMTACNMDQMVVTRIAADGTVNPIAVNADKLRTAIDSMSGELAVRIDGGHLHIAGSNGGKRKLQTLPASDFPKLPVEQVEHRFVIPAADLRTGLQRTHIAAGDHMSAVMLHGIRVIGDGGVKLIATDSTLFHIAALPVECEAFDAVTIATKMATTALGMLDEGDATFSCSPRLAVIQCGNSEVVSKVIEGDFAPWERVMGAKEANDAAIVGSAEELARAISAVGALSGDKARVVRIERDGDVVAAHASAEEAFEPMNVEAEGNIRFGTSARVNRTLGIFGERVVRWTVDSTWVHGCGRPSVMAITADDFPFVAVTSAFRV